MILGDLFIAGAYVACALAAADFAIAWSERRRPVRDDDGRWSMPRKIAPGDATPSARRAHGPRPAAARPPARGARDVGRPSPRYH